MNADDYTGGGTEYSDSGELPPNRKRHQRHLLACMGCRKIKVGGVRMR
jgi:hypothetical protein